MAWSVPRATREIWWFFLLILFGDTVLTGLNIARMFRNESDVNHTLKVLNDLNRLDAQLGDCDTSVRGYLLSGQNEFLAPYHDALPQIPATLSKLRLATADNDERQRNLAELAPIVREQLALFARLIDQRGKPDRDPDEQTRLLSDEQVLFIKVNQRLDKMVDDERDLLDARSESAHSALVASIIATVFGGALTIGTLIFIQYLLRRENQIRHQGEEALRQSEERFRVIAESLPQFVWVASSKGQFEYYNRRWYDYSGLSPDQSLGRQWSSALHPDDRERFERHWQRSLATGQRLDVEYRIRRRDGGYRWFLGRAIPLHGETGRVSRWFGTCTDIDDQKRAKEELEARVRERTSQLQQVVNDLNHEALEREKATELLNQMAAGLTRSNRELEQFAYVASHDLQEPLRKIQSFGDRLKLKFFDQLDEQARDYITRMQTAATRMRRLIDDLLAFSRVSTHPQPFLKTDLNEVLQEVMNDLEEAIERTGARVEIGPLPTIVADPLQMRQLMQNLISNALKFHKPGEPPAIAISARDLPRMPGDPPDAPDRPAVQIDFADNGIGFEETYRERIFQVFQRLHGRGEFEGTGIGLAIVRKIAERHGGTVSAQSAPDHGAVFTVLLPRGTDAVSDSDPDPTPAAAVPAM